MSRESEEKYNFGIYKIKEFASCHEITTRNWTQIEGNVSDYFDKFRMCKVRQQFIYEFYNYIGASNFCFRINLKRNPNAKIQKTNYRKRRVI